MFVRVIVVVFLLTIAVSGQAPLASLSNDLLALLTSAVDRQVRTFVRESSRPGHR